MQQSGFTHFTHLYCQGCEDKNMILLRFTIPSVWRQCAGIGYHHFNRYMFVCMSTALVSACELSHIIQLAVRPQPWALSIVCPKCFRQACHCLAALTPPWSNIHIKITHNMTLHSRESTQNQISKPEAQKTNYRELC